MPVGRFFQGLTAYDLLGNLVPGLIAFLAIEFFLPNPWIPSGTGGLALTALVAFVFGGVVQAHASKAIGDRRDFVESLQLRSNQEISRINMSEADESQESTSRPDAFDKAGILAVRSLLDPAFLLDRDERGTAIDNQQLASKIRKRLYMQYGLDSKAETWDTLYHLMISEVDSEDGDSIAIRMHTLRNFYRGVWIATWYLLVLLVATVVIGLLVACSDLPFELQSPGYTTLSVSVTHLVPLTAISCLIFRFLTEKRNDDFINYLFLDYARKNMEDESN